LLTGAWLAREAGLPKAVARRAVKVARKLRVLSEVDDALSAGRITTAHAGVMVDACNPRVTDAVVGLQSTFLGLIAGASFEQWQTEVRDLVSVLDEDGGHDPDRDVARNRLHMARTFDGVVRLDGVFVGTLAETVVAGIEAMTDEQFKVHSRDQGESPDLVVPERSNLRALGLVELIRRGAAVDVHTSRRPRPEVTLIVNAGDPGKVTGPTGVRLQDGTTRALLCDPDMHAVVVDRLGRPLDVGRRMRWATADQRRALAVRDGGCVFPGCDAPVAWCDAHHVEHFERGGRTDIANMVLLCRHHHGVTHRRGWQMIATDDQWFTWVTPTGRTVCSQRHGRRRQDRHAPPAAA
jgi:hypothetical protein